jgi:hypothetical protein
MAQAGESGDGKKIWVTLAGLPLTMTLAWPFHESTSGADFWVLHTEIRLESGEGLLARVAVNLSATVREVMASLEAKDAEAPVINALRKEVDRRQIEFVKSGKLLPLAFSSRHYDFKREKWVFGKATDEAIATFLERKIYWQTKLGGRSPLLAKDARNGAPGDLWEIPRPAGKDAGLRDDATRGEERDKGGTARIWIGDPTEAQYLETTTEHLLEIAERVLAGSGLIRMDGEWAQATLGLMARAAEFENAMRAAAEELEKKHAYERG